MDYGLYLYGIFPLPGPQDLALQGLDKQPVSTQVLDGFAVLYSQAQQKRYLASRRNLLGHEKVLEEAMQAGYRNLLPLQFGMLVQDWKAVSHHLITPYRQELEQLLAKLSDRREVGVKLFWDGEAEIQGLLEERPDLRAQRDSLVGQALNMEQVIGIGQAIEQSLEARKQSITGEFQNALNPIAIDVVENDPQMESMIYNAAYLIPWDAETQFSQRIEVLDQKFEGRLRIRYNNYTAPFNFAHFD